MSVEPIENFLEGRHDHVEVVSAGDFVELDLDAQFEAGLHHLARFLDRDGGIPGPVRDDPGNMLDLA